MISIHALLAESDPTQPKTHQWPGISIHALLAESDVNEDRYGQQFWRFLSTHSLRRATAYNKSMLLHLNISIHALLAESDCYGLRYPAQSWHFYPRSPCGERLILHMAHLMELLFLSTLSLRRATRRPGQNCQS